MKNFAIVLIPLLWICGFWSPTSARADHTWLPVSYGDLIGATDLVVVGRITEIREDHHADSHRDCAVLEVIEALRGEVPASGLVHLDFAAAADPDHHDHGGIAARELPTSVFYQKDQEGIWFLQKTEKTGTGTCYVADHPAQFKPMPFLPIVRQQIAMLGPQAPPGG